jgi:hypothetical protein
VGKIRRFATRTIEKVPLVFEDENGKQVTEEFNIVYRSYSQKVLDEIAEAEKSVTGDVVSFSSYLSHLVMRIVDQDGEDLTGESGEKQELNREFFDSMSIGDGTKVIWEAIQNDINPQKSSSERGASGSRAAAKEA